MLHRSHDIEPAHGSVSDVVKEDTLLVSTYRLELHARPDQHKIKFEVFKSGVIQKMIMMIPISSLGYKHTAPHRPTGQQPASDPKVDTVEVFISGGYLYGPGY